MKLSFAFTFALALTQLAWSNEVTTKRGPASYVIQAPDDQRFSLREFKLGEFTQYTLNFAIGQREQNRKFASKEQWIKWRTKWTYFMQNYPQGKCAHPLKLSLLESDVTKKTKEICLEKLTPSEREEIKKLVSAFDEFIYAR